MELLKQSSTAHPLIFFMYDDADHVTGKTGLSPTVTLSKDGAAFGAPAGAVSEIGNGFYKVAGNATDTATLGTLCLNATSAGADQCTMAYRVVAFDPDTATNLGLSAIPTANPGAANGALIAGSNAATTFATLTSTGAFTVGSLVIEANLVISGGLSIGGSLDVGSFIIEGEFAIGGVSSVAFTPAIAGRIDAAVSSRMATFTLPTNFSSLLINSSGHVSRVTLADTLTTYTGNTVQTGDSYARIGANGASLTALATAANLATANAALVLIPKSGQTNTWTNTGTSETATVAIT